MTFFRKLWFVLLVFCVLLCSCQGNITDSGQTEQPEETTKEAADVFIIQDRKTDYKLIFGDSHEKNPRASASDLAGVFLNNCGVIFSAVAYDKTEASEFEIIYGRTDRQLSIELADAIDAYPKNTHAWGIAYRDGKLAICTNSDIALSEFCLQSLKAEFVRDRSFVVKENLWHIFTITEADYQLMLEKEAAEKEAAAYAERVKQIEILKKELAEVDTAEYGGELLTYLADAPKPQVYPKKGQHPRLYFTEEDIPGMRAAMEDPDNAEGVTAFMTYVNMKTDGKLPEAKFNKNRRDYNDTFMNFNAEPLTAIQSKALYYVLTGDELYGWEAICAIKNFILTLDIQQAAAGSTGEYVGRTMVVAACVYDWCYDLLSDTDREQLLRGIETRLCHPGVELEFGFPPKGFGTVSGHGCGSTVLNSFHTVAIAIYDEQPCWYEYFGGLYFSAYIPAREYFYGSGVHSQGTWYGMARFLSDIKAAWLYMTIGVELPYAEDMAKVARSYACNVTWGDEIFASGDGYGVQVSETRLRDICLVSAYLFNDPVARAIAKETYNGYGIYAAGHGGLKALEFIILSSSGIKPVENSKDHLPEILHNGDWLGQLITRRNWAVNSAVTQAKIGQRTFSNHDHQDHGTFQIYYKGLLTGDSGVYELYGTDHWRFYHQATLAHNGLLIFNPSKHDALPVDANNDGVIDNRVRYWYSGSQRYTGETSKLETWLTSRYDYGTVTGVKYSYEPDGETAKYSYIAGDITKAYDTDTVDYVSRSMLTAYTGDDEFPMVFFVFDRIDADQPNYKKTFLLHVNGKEAPVIEGNTVTITNKIAGSGMLVNTSLIGGDEIVPVGGTNAAGNPQNFLINGVQCNDPDGKTDEWGRVEISPAPGNKSDLLLNVMYVTDLSQTKKLTPVRVTSDNALLEGSSVAGITAMFSTAREKITASCTFNTSGSGEMTYYIGGLAAGTWTVTVNGKEIASTAVSEEEAMLTFRAEAGSVSIERRI